MITEIPMIVILELINLHCAILSQVKVNVNRARSGNIPALYRTVPEGSQKSVEQQHTLALPPPCSYCVTQPSN